MKMHLVVKQLKVVQLKARKELIAATNALAALGANHATHRLSAAARQRIAAAQRKRWALVRKQNGRKAA